MRFLRLLLLVVLVLLAARLVGIQVLGSSRYQAQARQELAVGVTIPPLRGGIYDRNGSVLAMSVPTQDLVADDFQVTEPAREAMALAPLLGVGATRVAAELHKRSGYVVLARQIPEATATRIAADAFPGLTTIADSQRHVPNGSLATPLLGFTNGSGAGAAGLEYEYQNLLAGTPGRETILESPSGVALPQAPVVNKALARPGTGIETTVDEPLQFETEQALAAEIEASHAVSGTAEVMDVRTGQVLSMANLVARHPGGAGASPASAPAPASGTPGSAAASVAQAPSNLALTQLYEPGSVFKLVTFSAALQDRVISPTSVFTVPDHLTLDGSTFHDAEVHPTEQLSATQILAQSSNIGTSEIAQSLGQQRLLGQVANLGFGRPTGLHFPGESTGLIATAAQWHPTDLVSLPIGQVDAVTAQQVLDAYNAVADGGVFVDPSLVRATVATDGVVTPTAPSPTHRVLSPTTDAQLGAMLQQVVQVGTGTSADIPGYAVAGKTGTAQIPTPGKDSYLAGAYMASFVGFAPAVNPVFSAIVVLDRPTPIFGGTVAAPVFSQIVGYALHRFHIPTSPGAPAQPSAPPGGSGTVQAQDIT